MNTEMKRLGFLVGIPYLCFVFEIGQQTMLVVEGEKKTVSRDRYGNRIQPVQGISYCFYKARYQQRYHQTVTKLKVYAEHKNSAQILVAVRKYMRFLNEKRGVKG